jgi:ketosteroid isomerase-like protein
LANLKRGGPTNSKLEETMYLLPMIFSLLGMFSVATLWAPVAAENPSATKQNDPSIVEKADAYLKAIVAGDAPAVATMFEHDAILMPPNQRLVRGRLPIQRFYEGWCHGPMKPASFSFDHLEATVSSDYAYDVGTYKMSIFVGPSRSINETGKYTAVFKRSAGEWNIAYLIFNSDLPPQPQAVVPAK